MIHELKTWPGPFKAVWEGHKTYEVRKNDRAYEPDHVLHLLEWDPVTKRFLGPAIRAVVTYVTYGGNFGVPEDMVVMAIRVIERSDASTPKPDVGATMDKPQAMFILEHQAKNYKTCRWCYSRPAEPIEGDDSWYDGSEPEKYATPIILEAANLIYGPHDPSCLAKRNAYVEELPLQKAVSKARSEGYQEAEDRIFSRLNEALSRSGLGWRLTRPDRLPTIR